MNSNRPAMRHNRRVPGITGLVLLTFLASAAAQASEKDELASVQRQLDEVQASLERARVVAAQADPADRGRFFFDYRQATSDLNTIRSGIDRYLEPSRAQPREPSSVAVLLLQMAFLLGIAVAVTMALFKKYI
ncbi:MULTISPECIES: integrative conjugative element protein, RAQPRD family [Enterobacterales]|uniref:integrative conjugative element protein, RAQPRD family n=1 Tax=Enterobacterales TaxID=91347 RepID=UPI001E336B5E|nr:MULTISPECIES: RAQPRD family integrative conjugative element protein [Enterobacterales]